MSQTPTDIEIAQSAELRPIVEIAETLGLGPGDIENYGHYKAKVPLGAFQNHDGPKGRLVLVTAISPTPAGEGKSTISVGLADALNVRGRNPVLCLREPSLGPVFGIKGGAAGGGYSQVVPMADINLHFTGDFHAITAAHGLLSAMLDNHLFRPNDLNVDQRQIVWPRAVDMNDRALRSITIGLGGRLGGIPREDHFVITAASEIMAIFCLADGLPDLTRRLGEIIVAYTRDGTPIRAKELDAPGAMTVLLRDAINPNLVQTLGRTPAFIHGGPFANIAHGCNSLIATRAGLAFGDIVVTEAGFGADLGAEKFFDIKCRVGGLEPEAVVLVATVRALKMHGGVKKDQLAMEDVAALKRGLPNLVGHVENLRKFGVPAIVAVNRFATDTAAEVQSIIDACKEMGVQAVESDPHSRTAEGMLELADAVTDLLAAGGANYKPLYPLDMTLREKIEMIAGEIYGSEGVEFLIDAEKSIERLEGIGMGDSPVCMAKTQYSFSDNPDLLGRPSGFHITVRDVIPAAGAGFVVAKTGDIMTMPGLSARPAATGMSVKASGEIVGLA